MATIGARWQSLWRYLPLLNVVAYNTVVLLDTLDVVPFDWIPDTVMLGYGVATVALMVARLFHTLMTPKGEPPAEVKASRWPWLNTVMSLVLMLIGIACMFMAAYAFFRAQQP